MVSSPRTLASTLRRDASMSDTTPVPSPTADQKRIAQDSFAQAREAIAERQLDYAIALLLTCCKLDPGNFFYRQTLRKTQKDKFGNNLRGSRFAFLTTPRWKAKVKGAKRSRDYLRVLEHAEQVLCRNPWDMGTQMDMAEAFDALGLSDLAVFTLDQARQKYPRDATLNRALARLFEKRGDFQKAIVLWQLVRESHPSDVEAAHKAKDLAASETIAKGQYEEAAAGTKESPVLGRIEARAVEKQDKVAREADPLREAHRGRPDRAEPCTSSSPAVYRRHGQADRARAALQQGLGPTGNAFQIQLELMDIDLVPVRKNLEHTEARLRKLRHEPRPTTRRRTTTDDRARTMTEKELTPTPGQARQGDQRPGDRHLPGEGRSVPDRGASTGSNSAPACSRPTWSNEAIEELQQAQRDDRLKWKAEMYLGVCFKKRNNWRLAQRNFEEALAGHPARRGGREEGTALPTRQRVRRERRPAPRHRPRATNSPTSTSASRTSANCSTSGTTASRTHDEFLPSPAIPAEVRWGGVMGRFPSSGCSPKGGNFPAPQARHRSISAATCGDSAPTSPPFARN